MSGQGIQFSTQNHSSGFGAEGSQEEGLGGFQPAAWGNNGGFNATGSPLGGVEEDFLDDEEKERVSRVEQDNDDRKRALFDKLQAEEDSKRQRKARGKEEIDKWTAQRKREIEQQLKTNEENEKMHHENVTAQRNGPNPWDRVVSNCDMNSASYVGGADVTRMRQAMIARKADLTKSGGQKKTI